MTKRTIELSTIKTQMETDRSAFVAQGEREYHDKVYAAAAKIVQDAEQAPIVLLSGPSGSGKTTTAFKLREAVQEAGRPCQVVSMDDYFLTVNPGTHPRGPDGQIDFESPYCLDIELFNRHLEALRRGETVEVPHFDFPNQRRQPDMTTTLSIGSGGVCIFEGIHALNPIFSEHLSDCTKKVYVSARANIMDGNKLAFKGTWIRLIRRMVRDNNFRGWAPQRTMELWASVRRGEKTYISPFHGGAHMAIDTHMPYEICVMRHFAQPMFMNVPDCERREELLSILPALKALPEAPPWLIPENSLLHEFIG